MKRAIQHNRFQSRKILPLPLFSFAILLCFAWTTLFRAPNTNATEIEPTASVTEPSETASENPPSESLPKAKNINLGEPVTDVPAATIFEQAPVNTEVITKPETQAEPSVILEEDQVVEEETPKDTEVELSEPLDKPSHLIMLGADVPPATSTRLIWSPSQSFDGTSNTTPVLVVHGAKSGPVLCLTAAVHGDELNGVEIVRRVLYNINPLKLSGTVIGVPIVNLQGFRRSSRYLADRRDLNRFFPGNPQGSSASRIAHSFFNEIILKCDALVDLHTGSFHRTNLPQLRADLSNLEVVKLTQGLGAIPILQKQGGIGTLRRAAMDAGIPAVTLEAGEPMRLQEDAIRHGVKGIQTLMSHLGMAKKISFWGDPEPIYYQSAWVRTDHGGILLSNVALGQRVNKGDLLGSVTNPVTNVRWDIMSPNKGRILGMALNQVVMPGFAAFHIGIQASEEELSSAEDVNTPVVINSNGSNDSEETAPSDNPEDPN